MLKKITSFSRKQFSSRKRTFITSGVLLAALAIVLVSVISIGNNGKKPPVIDPAFSNYISAYTAGIVSKQSTIRIRLANDYTGFLEEGQPVDMSLLRISPSVQGAAHWVDARTIEFVPEEMLTSGTVYDVEFFLAKIMEVAEEKLSVFAFQFRTIKQNFNVLIDGLYPYDFETIEWQKLKGRIITSDIADTAAVQQILSAVQNKDHLKIHWEHEARNIHRFVIDSITRVETPGKVTVEWDGDPLGVDNESSRVVEVPALGDFKITNVRVVHSPEQYITLQFSDPLQQKQNLRGIIRIEDERSRDLSFQIEGNTITIYPTHHITGTKKITVSTGIKNFRGYKMAEEDFREVLFEELKPEVRFIGDGAIIPNDEKGVLLPFEAVSLRSVDVYITQIYENNIMQFLQVNDLNGRREMKRVSRKIYQKTVDLRELGNMNLHEWNLFSLDLRKIVKVEPGAIYQVEIKFDKDNSIYSCGGDSIDINADLVELEPVFEQAWSEEEWGSYYDYDYEYYYDDYYYYEDDYDPCEDEYYYYRRKTVRRNIIASDIGLIAKVGQDRTVHVVANDIRTTAPLKGAKVEFYDYQQQLISSTVTDGRGMSAIQLNAKPFIMVAKYGKQRGYLRMRDGESLSLSKFDVSGETVEEGVKGFVYTERGVRRPGDSVYVGFLLEDKNHLLPSSHPVTMELIDPHGQTVETMTTTKSTNGLYAFRTATDAEAPTGNWRADINVGNRTFTQRLKVETVKPNRLKIYLDFGKSILTTGDKDHKANLNVKWLHGASAKNLKAKIDVTVNQATTSFAKFRGYIFDDPLVQFYAEQETVFEGQVDENGQAVFDADLQVGDASPGMLRAHFVTKVFEEGGNFSIDRHSIAYSPYESYVGIDVPEGELYQGTLVTDKDHVVQVATVDARGTPISRKKLEVKVYKIEWRWWWDSYDNDLASYIGKSSTVPILDQTISTYKGKGKFNLRVDRPGWGRYLVHVTDPESGHSTGKIVYIDWPYWARGNRTNNEHATMLSFSTDKDKYKVGELVKLSFPSASNGRALVCLESGTKIIKKYWVNTVKGETKFEFPTLKEMTPNVFVHVSLLQPHNATKNDLPIRMYGVVPITVDDPASHLNPLITMRSVLRPETTASIKVKEEHGKAMSYTLAVVDEGLLDLTGFKTPSPWGHFNAREALGVKTWDLYDHVMGAYGGELNRILSIGGDGEGGNGRKKAKANRFKPMVKFLGPFELKKGEEVIHKVKIPNYVGSVRVMVVAGQDRAYGESEKTVPVRSPLMVLGTLPRVLGPAETVQLPVNVFAMEKHVKDVTVEIVPNEMFTVNGTTKQRLKFEKTGDEVVNFELAVADKVGVGKVTVIARSGKEKAVYEVELQVRAPNPEVVDVKEVVVQPGKSWSSDFAFKGIEGTNKGTVEITTLPPIDLGQRLKYLIQYPHGCIEQTTSSVFPQLALHEVLNLDRNHQREIAKNINAGLKRLSLFQTDNGGFSYWPGGYDDSEWGTNYAGNFMLEAEKRGYRLPSGMKQRWVSYQSDRARSWSGNNANNAELDQAYRLYTLALAGKQEMGAMNRLRERSNLSLQARWRLAAAYELVGQHEVAVKLIEGRATTVKPYKELSYTFGSDARDEAMILETLSLMNNKAKAATLARRLAKKMSDKSNWMSTQTTAYCLIAMSRFMESNSSSNTMQFAYSVDGGKTVVKRTTVPVYHVQLSEKQVREGGKLELTNNGKGILYVRLTTEGIPVTGDQSTANSNISMNIRYTTMEGREIDPVTLEQGTDFLAEVEISNPGTRGQLKEVALSQIFPSGWEIHNTRMDGFSASYKGDTPTYQDIRDDRVYTYFNISAGSTKTFKFMLNATYMGKFYLPTVAVEAMYDNTVNARRPGKWVEVVKPAPLTQ